MGFDRHTTGSQCHQRQFWSAITISTFSASLAFFPWHIIAGDRRLLVHDRWPAGIRGDSGARVLRLSSHTYCEGTRNRFRRAQSVSEVGYCGKRNGIIFMESSMRRIVLMWCVAMLLIVASAFPQQYLLTLTDVQCVEASLDMIRKGVQQGSVDRVMKVMGESVSIKSAKSKTDTEIARDLGLIFANSARRTVSGMAQATVKSDSTASDPGLGDFDILSSKITIREDSAFVDCELVLWDAFPNGSAGSGSRTAEHLVLYSPGTGHPEQTASRDPLRWRLVKCGTLFDFVGEIGGQSTANASKNGGQQ